MTKQEIIFQAKAHERFQRELAEANNELMQWDISDVLNEEYEAEAVELDLEPISFYDQEEKLVTKPTKEAELTKITVRASGKCHRAIVHPLYGMMISCSCPGSRNGKLESQAVKVADGWDKANCGN